MQAKLRVSAPRGSQLIGSTLAAHAVHDLPLPTTGGGAILGPTTTPNPGNVGLPAMIAWLALKLVANWQNRDDIKDPLDKTNYKFSAIVTGLLSMLFAYVGGVGNLALVVGLP
jgi:hypothetical protein